MKVLRALIVDPDHTSRREMAGLLDECCFDSLEATDGVHALQFASEYAIDLIVTEIQIPKLDVLQLLHIIRCGAFGWIPPPVIVCSASLQDRSWLTSPALRGLTLLARPFTARSFAVALDAAFPAD